MTEPEFLTEPVDFVTEEHERRHVFNWWVSRPMGRDAYCLYVTRYEMVDGKPVSAEYRTDEGWQPHGDHQRIEPLFVLPGDVLHVLDRPGVDERGMEEWLQGLVTTACAKLVAAVAAP